MLIEKFDYRNCIVEIWTDKYSESPRHWDTFGTFWTLERNQYSPDLIVAADGAAAWLAPIIKAMPDRGTVESRLSRETIWLPVWKYEHSGVVYRAEKANPFSCPWDSGQVGIIFVDKAKVRSEFEVERITSDICARAYEYLRNEVSTYSAWCNGEVYRYDLISIDGEITDSCGGFIDSVEYVKGEAKRAVDESL